ncbi:prion-inhibition and propagation-domain-containing protein [Hyaloscypha sp. PMI_1271]|nr:prion-inhibition and propagation-domain-containing protein [Hyaloscypha sp. PMI_1271]
MAEIAGLVVGGVALASLFSTCVECFDDIELARQYSKDYEIFVTKVDLLRTRLDLWGRTVWVEKGDERVVVEVWKHEWSNVGESVGRSLVGIKETLQDVQTLQDKYALETIPQSAKGPSVVAVASSDVAMVTSKTSKAFNELHNVFSKNVMLRKKETSVRKKTAWAIHDRAKFDELISTLSTFLDGLEKVSDQLGVLAKQRRMFEQEITQITNTESLALLRAATESLTSLAAGAAGSASEGASNTNPSSTFGHEYVSAVATQRAIQINGDVGLEEQMGKGPGNKYVNPKATGESLQINGGVSAAGLGTLRR